MELNVSSPSTRFFVTVIILAIVLFVFEDALVELALGAGKEQSTVIELLEVVAALAVSFFAVRRAFRIAQKRV